MVMKTCNQIEGGLPTAIKTRMMFNIIIDFVIGLVPFLGDLADAVYRANTRNAMLLEEHLREKGKKYLRQSGQPMPAIDPSSPEEYDRIQNSNSPDPRSQPPSRQPSTHSARQPQQSMPSEPRPAEVRGGSGWFGRGKTRPDDVEMGQVNAARHDSRRKDKRSGRR